MKVRLLLIVVTVFLLTSCSKDDPSFGEMKISKVYAGGQLQVEYSYNSAGLLKTYTVYGFPGRKSSEVSCEYDGNNRLIKKETALDFSSGPNPVWSYSYTEYTYGPDGKISEERNYLMQNSTYILASKIKPSYDANGRLGSRGLYLPNDALALLTTYQYNSAGNITLQEQFRYSGTTAQLEFRYTYDDYDNKRNPHIGLPSAVPPFSVNNNNILKTTVTNYVVTPGTPVTSTNNSVYSLYNASGLPLNVVENGTTFVYEYR
jgi:hypothetical protein